MNIHFSSLPQKSLKLDALDFLRGALALLIVLAHTRQIFVHPLEEQTGITGYLLGLLARGAVLFFFCLSGYVISLSIAKNIQRNGHFKPWDFFVARVFRLLPPLLGIILLTAVIAGLMQALQWDTVPLGAHAARSAYVTDVASQLQAIVSLGIYGDITGAGLNGPLWTLTYEIQLYIFAGLVASLVTPRMHLAVRLVSAALLLYYLELILHPLTAKHMYARHVTYLCFVFGSAMFFLAPRLSKRQLCVLLLPCLALAVYFGYLAADYDCLIWLDGPWLNVQIAMAAVIAIAMMLIADNAPLGRLAGLSKLSYTLYILHFPLILAGYMLLYHVYPALLQQQPWLTGLACLLLAIVISRVTGNVLERPVAQQALISRGSAALRHWLVSGPKK